jgi:hypothetical protein
MARIRRFAEGVSVPGPGRGLTDVCNENHSKTENNMHQIKMPPYGHR